MLKLPAQKIKKIAVFRALQLGDMLCSVPAIRALRNAYPDAEITLIGLPWASSLVERFDHYFDHFISFTGYVGLPEQPFDPLQFPDFLKNVQAQEFDLAIQMQGNGTLVNPLVEMFAAKYTAGFKTNGHYAPDNDLFLTYPNYGSEIERHILLMEYLGIEPKGNDLEFPLTENDLQELAGLNLNIEPGSYVCIHPGSRGAWRQWPVENFAALADYCAEQDYKVVLTGTKDESFIINEVIMHMKSEAVNTAGRTSVGAVAALIKDAVILISNCTGVSHIASALKTPSIVISMDGEPERWGPLNKDIHKTINWQQSPDFHLVFRETVDLITSVG